MTYYLKAIDGDREELHLVPITAIEYNESEHYVITDEAVTDLKSARQFIEQASADGTSGMIRMSFVAPLELTYDPAATFDDFENMTDDHGFYTAENFIIWESEGEYEEWDGESFYPSSDDPKPWE